MAALEASSLDYYAALKNAYWQKRTALSGGADPITGRSRVCSSSGRCVSGSAAARSSIFPRIVVTGASNPSALQD